MIIDLQFNLQLLGNNVNNFYVAEPRSKWNVSGIMLLYRGISHFIAR